MECQVQPYYKCCSNLFLDNQSSLIQVKLHLDLRWERFRQNIFLKISQQSPDYWQNNSKNLLKHKNQQFLRDELQMIKRFCTFQVCKGFSLLQNWEIDFQALVEVQSFRRPMTTKLNQQVYLNQNIQGCFFIVLFLGFNEIFLQEL